MVAKEFNIEPARQEVDDRLLRDSEDEDEEAEETLSLCDLVMNKTAEDCHANKSYEEEQGSSDQDFFEFFSEDFSAASTYPTDKIIFCGKVLFPYNNGLDINNRTLTQNSFPKQQKLKKMHTFPWKLNLFDEMKTQQQEMKTASTLATTMKSRWYLFAFGMGRFDTEMEMKDLRMRQSRRISRSMFRVDSRDENNQRREKRSRKKGWRGLLKKVLETQARKCHG